MLGAIVRIAGAMKIVPEEQATPFRCDKEWQKGKGGTTARFYIR